ncbi:hypothetical protein O7635_12490 [Asanoa sp. WMMD1127]|uniref:hypothetical protein n=1 Tax=Asanoa sp. WMMD1127 TaxID=3016107 RepID=UPI002415F40F|nr:hypothetical protein [Asanoa sp. WMMD1127]MDG4822669.1 hypothetical protein [Asanoa sp. WMMD1127]
MRVEEKLRDAFRDQVQLTPAGVNRADRIIQRTHRTRRWRRAGTSLAAVLAFVVLIGGITGWQLLRSPRVGYDSSVLAADPTALPRPLVTAKIDPHDVASLGLDLRIGDLLWTTDGRRFDLGAHGDVDQAYRVPAGWLYGTSGGVYLQPESGPAVQVAPEDSRWSVSEDGSRIAVVADELLTVAELGPQGAKPLGVANVTGDAAPTALLGDRVLVAGEVPGGRGYEFVKVTDDSDKVEPAWNPAVSGVFGIRSDAAVGLAWTAGEEQLCLAALRPNDGPSMSVALTRVCGFVPSSEDLTHSLSPDGGWLAEPAGDDLALVSVDHALVGIRSAKSCAAAGVRSPVWIDSRTVVAPYDGGVVRCQTDGVRKVLEAPAAAGVGWDLVPRLGSTTG